MASSPTATAELNHQSCNHYPPGYGEDANSGISLKIKPERRYWRPRQQLYCQGFNGFECFISQFDYILKYLDVLTGENLSLV